MRCLDRSAPVCLCSFRQRPQDEVHCLFPVGKRHPAGTLYVPGWVDIHCLCPLRYTSLFGFPCHAYFLREICWKKNQDKPVNSLRHKGFPICPYYAIRAYVRNCGSAKRSGYQDGLRDAGPLQRRVYAGHLRPRYHPGTASGGEYHGEYPLRCC